MARKGSVRVATGAFLYSADYDPYGVPLTAGLPTTLGFTGEQADPTGLLYLRARYLVPKPGILLTRDRGFTTGQQAIRWREAQGVETKLPSQRIQLRCGLSALNVRSSAVHKLHPSRSATARYGAS